MKSIVDINRQMSKVQSAITALNATNTIVQMVMIAGGKPVIRITKNSHCAQLLEQGKASYIHIGQGDEGPYRQGVFYLYGCRIIWSESLH